MTIREEHELDQYEAAVADQERKDARENRNVRRFMASMAVAGVLIGGWLLYVWRAAMQSVPGLPSQWNPATPFIVVGAAAGFGAILGIGAVLYFADRETRLLIVSCLVARIRRK